MFFLIALGIYIGVGVLFMLLRKNWSMILVLVMAAIPLAIVVIGLLKHYGSRAR
jgi:multisubunit Na+/H+ antiporter MnhC subunit